MTMMEACMNSPCIDELSLSHFACSSTFFKKKFLVYDFKTCN